MNRENRRTCVVCGTDLLQHRGSRCTNGCCGSCHGRYCTPGGITSPGHGLNLRAALRDHQARILVATQERTAS